MSKHITNSTDPYQVIHDRLEATRGKASTYRCACGCGEQAAEWRLDVDTVGTLSVVRHEGQSRWISTQVFDYSHVHDRHETRTIRRVADRFSPPPCRGIPQALLVSAHRKPVVQRGHGPALTTALRSCGSATRWDCDPIGSTLQPAVRNCEAVAS